MTSLLARAEQEDLLYTVPRVSRVERGNPAASQSRNRSRVGSSSGLAALVTLLGIGALAEAALGGAAPQLVVALVGRAATRRSTGVLERIEWGSCGQAGYDETLKYSWSTGVRVRQTFRDSKLSVLQMRIKRWIP